MDINTVIPILLYGIRREVGGLENISNEEKIQIRFYK